MNEIEQLIGDQNKTIGSMAVSIMLKICKEENIEKLLSQIYEYLTEMSDDFKIDVLRSIKSLLKFSKKKYANVLAFLTNCLK